MLFKCLNRFKYRRLPRITTKSPASLKWLSEKVLNGSELPEAYKWTTGDVLNWLACIGLPQYKSTFQANWINGRTLLLLNASRLCAMNVKVFRDIQVYYSAFKFTWETFFYYFLQKVLREIRKLYQIELDSVPEIRYKLFKVKTGPFYENCTRTEFFKAAKITTEPKIPLNHFERLHHRLNIFNHIPSL